jgi:hypothetical protein
VDDGFTRFSFGFGAGLKQFLGPRFAIRAEAKWLPILIDPQVGPWACGTVGVNGCVVFLSGPLTQQFELSVGPVVRFYERHVRQASSGPWVAPDRLRLHAAEVGGVVDAAGALVARHLGIGAQRRVRVTFPSTTLLAMIGVRRLSLLHPVDDGRHGVVPIRTVAAAAVRHPGIMNRRKKSGVDGPFTAVAFW